MRKKTRVTSQPVTAPDFGVNSAALEARQLNQGWQIFNAGGKDYIFGRPNSVVRFSHIGRGTRSQEEPPIATIAIAGRGISVADAQR